MSRAYTKQRKFKGRAKHRAEAYARYMRQTLFNCKVSIYFHPDSTTGYTLAKWVYWNEKYRDLSIEPFHASEYNLQGLADIDVKASYPDTLTVRDFSTIEAYLNSPHEVIMDNGKVIGMIF